MSLDKPSLIEKEKVVVPAMEAEPKERIAGIFIQKETLHNMDMERIYVANFVAAEIVKQFVLTPHAQQEAVDKLVDRTLNWMEIDEYQQMEMIKAVLSQEAVIEWLRQQDHIRKDADMVDTGIDEEGSYVVTAFYTKMNRDMKRMLQKQMSKKDQEKLETAVNILDGNQNLIDLATEKLKRKQAKGFRK